MQLLIQKSPYDSVQVFWVNRALLRERLLECVKDLVTKKTAVQKVVLFGSVAEYRETASSDVDILIVVKESQERFIDRFIKFSDFFGGLKLGVAIFVYTQEEIERSDISLARTALKRVKLCLKGS
jgi:predicted nucleotidyltransferase